MSMTIAIYDTSTGVVQRVVRNASDPTRQNIANNEAMVTSDDVDIPDGVAEMVYDPDAESFNERDVETTVSSVNRDLVSDDTRVALGNARDDLAAARDAGDVEGEVAALETIVDELLDVVTGDSLATIDDEV
jgi:hypothetical protein